MKKIISLTVFIHATFALYSQFFVVGQVSQRDAYIWCHQIGESSINLVLTNNQELPLSSTVVPLNDELGFTGIGSFHNLIPGTTYKFHAGDDTTNYSFTTQPLWQHRNDPPELNIAFGSCAFLNDQDYDRPGKSYGGDTQIFNYIAQKKPTAMIWLGDNVYFREGDWDSKEGMVSRYLQSRTHPDLQKLWTACPHYAIWDDHDFGPNDSNGSFALKRESLEVFRAFWPSSQHGIDGIDGVISHQKIGDIELFMLDNRYHRTANNLTLVPYVSTTFEKGEEILGIEQIQWLINALKTSNASYKLICIGGQFLNPVEVYENFSNCGRERKYILDLLEVNQIKNVIFLSGDRHCGEISRYAPKGSPVIYELTSSPLTSGPADLTQENNTLRYNNRTVPQRHFAVLEIKGPLNQRTAEVVYYDSDGNEIFREKLTP